MVAPVVKGALIGGLADFLGGERANRANARENQVNRQHQLHMAKNQIQMRMADAKAAGVSPHAALGISPMSGSGSSIPMQNTLSGMGNAIASAGRSMQTPAQRQMDTLTLEKAKLENDLLRSEVAKSNLSLIRANKPGMLPPTHTSDLPGQEGSISTYSLDGTPKLRRNASVGEIANFAEQALTKGSVIEPSRVESSHARNVHITSGHHPPYSYIRSGDGYVVVPSEKYKQAIEDSPWEWTAWWNFLRNANEHKPHWPPKPGHRWVFAPVRSKWVQVRNK